MRCLNRGTCLRTIALAATAAVIAVGCSGEASPGSGPKPTGPTLATPRTSPSPQPSLPNPFTVAARFSASSLGLKQPVALAIGPDGNVYVTDHRPGVTVITPRGKVLRRWGRAGKGPGQFRFAASDPTSPSAIQASIAVGPDGRVYVSDGLNHRVQVFTSTGKFVRQFGSYGTRRGQFLDPFDLAVDRAGNVYVADDVDKSVSKFSPAGGFVWRIGGASPSDPDLLGHEHLTTLDSSGRIVMANDDRGRILYVDSKGRKVDAFGASGDFPDGACNVTVDASGYTYVNSCVPGETQVFDPSHKLIGGWYGNRLVGSIRFGPKGEIFVLGGDHSILRLQIALPQP